MEAHVDAKILTTIIGWVLIVLGGGIAWGKLNEKVKKHDEAVKGCHMGEYQKKTDCKTAIAECSGAKHGADTYRRVVRIESDIQEIKDDLKKSDGKFHTYQVDQGAVMARIETQLGTLIEAAK